MRIILSDMITKSNLRSLICEILTEDAYKRRTGERFTDDVQKIRDTLDQPGYFVHFTDVPKIGVNTKSRYLVGTYFYPNTKQVFDGFIRNVVGSYRGAGRAARYVYLVKLRPGLRIIEGAEINDRILETIRKSMSPFESIGLDDSIRSRDPRTMASFKEFAHLFHMNMSGVPRVKPPSVSEMRESGLLNTVMRNYDEFADIYWSLLNRPRMKEEAKKGFVDSYNDRLRSFLSRFGSDGFYQRNMHLDDLSARSINNLKKQMERLLEPGKSSPDGRYTLDLVTLDRELTSPSASYMTGVRGPYMGAGAGADTIAKATIAMSGTTGMVKSYVENMSEIRNVQESVSYLQWIYNPKAPNMELMLSSGDSIKMKEITDRCVEILEQIVGKDANMLRQAVMKGDSVGANIIMAMAGEDFDGINDTGADETKFLWGTGGRLGKFESAQLFLKAPVSNKIDIITMIDRFEGESESWEPPGTATPDIMAGEEETDPRVDALLHRLKKKVGTTPTGYDKMGSRERWKGKTPSQMPET